MKNLFLAGLLAGVSCLPLSGYAKTATVTSPGNIVSITLSDSPQGLPVVSVSAFGTEVLAPSPVGLELRGRKTPLAVKSVKKGETAVENISAPFHHTPSYQTKYNSAVVDLGEGLAIELKAFDDAAAYRFVSSRKGETIVDNETADFMFPMNPELFLAYSTNDKKPMAMAFQALFEKVPASSAPDRYAFLPAASSYPNGVKAVFTESDLEAYPGMFLVPDSTTRSLKAVFPKYPSKTDFYPWRVQEYVTETEDYIAKADGPRAFPWRVVAVSQKDAELPVNNAVYTLASPSRVADTSWIKPGKVAWDWWNDWGLRGVDFKAGINTETYKHYIDFASENGIEYIVLDEGWYDPKSGDMLTIIDDIDLPGLIAYGKEKNVDIVLWTVFNVLDRQLKEACGKYSAMGIKGFKVDFLDRNDQTAVEMAYRIAEEAAKNKLFLDYHGYYTPTGLQRTYPNVINFEAVFGMEEMKWSDPSVDMPHYNVTFPYFRQLCGPVDFTPGAMLNASKQDWKAIYYNPMSQGTRAHQVATYIVCDSPFTMLADTPSRYRQNQPTVDFITSLPTVFESSEIIDGNVGEYIVTLRRDKGNYYVAGMTDWTPRPYTLSFDFLPEGREYTATLLRDGVNAAKQGDDHKIETFKVRKGDTRLIDMAPGGGFAIKIL